LNYHDNYHDSYHDSYHEDTMTLSEVQELIVNLRKLNADLTHVEAKQASTDIPKRLWETLSAFSNTPQGGVLILGVAEESGFAVTGIKDAAKIQHDLASLCSEMEPQVRAHIQIHEIEGKHVVTAGIPEMPLHNKPCFYPSAGLTNGAFIRVADGDRKLSAYEVQMMLSSRGQPREDEEPVPGTGIANLQQRLVKGYIARLRRRPAKRFLNSSEESILRTTKVLVRHSNQWVCSLAGLLAMGKYPQEFFPALSLTFIAYPNSIVGAPSPNQERFLDNERIEGCIPDILGPTRDVLQRNMRKRSVVQGLYRVDVDEYPLIAFREAIINSLVHRDLSSGSRGTPVQVQLFPDRLVIHNPGGLYGPVTVDSLGREGICASRNNTLLRILEDVLISGERQAVCENRGSGVGAMVAALTQAGLSKPLFDDRISSFRVTFRNASTRRSSRDRRQDILNLLRNNGQLSRSELSNFLQLTDISTRKWLQTLRAEGLVETTEVNSRSKRVKYRLVGGHS
jgi:ATP-dependent DNA helicase RecG